MTIHWRQPSLEELDDEMGPVKMLGCLMGAAMLMASIFGVWMTIWALTS